VESAESEFDVFVRTLLRDFGAPTRMITGDSLLSSDLGFDSLQTFELLSIAETMAGFDAATDPNACDPEPFQPIMTMGDIFKYYTNIVKRAG